MSHQQPRTLEADIRSEVRLHVDERDGPKGRPFRRVRERRLFVAAVLGGCLALTGCAGDSTGGTPNPSPSATIKIQFFKLGKTAPSSKGTVTIYGYDPAVKASGGESPEPGQRFVAIDVEGCAGPSADANTGIEPLLFYLQFKSEPLYPIDPGVRQPALHKTVLAPGRCARGWVTFEIPQASKPQYAFFRSTKRIAWILPK
jgi:hypothetical protein